MKHAPVAVILAAAWLGAPALATAAPPASKPAAVERRLHVDQVEASSFLWNDWNKFQENYHPLYIGDDDPKTAWVEGAKGSGAGEWLRLRVTEMEGTTRVRLRMRAGYQKSAGLFKANARPRELTVKLLPDGATRKVTLEDAQGWQEIVIDQPAGKAASTIDGIELAFDSVYEGSKYEDLSISDVQVLVTAATRENPAFEKSKRDRILTWKKERTQAAKLFKASAGKDLPLLPSYHYTMNEPEEYAFDTAESCDGNQVCIMRAAIEHAHKDAAFAARHREALAIARNAAAKGMPGLVPGKVAPVDKRPIPAVDGLYVPDLYQLAEGGYGYSGMELPLLGMVASLRADLIGALEIKEKRAIEDVLTPSTWSCHKSGASTHVWLQRDKAPAGAADAGKDRLRALMLVECGRIEVRDGEEDVAVVQFAVYDANGQLELVAGPGYVTGYTWSRQGERPVLAGGSGLYLDGRRAELTGPAVAKAP